MSSLEIKPDTLLNLLRPSSHCLRMLNLTSVSLSTDGLLRSDVFGELKDGFPRLESIPIYRPIRWKHSPAFVICPVIFPRLSMLPIRCSVPGSLKEEMISYHDFPDLSPFKEPEIAKRRGVFTLK